ncbi:MAG: hypothetical protein E6G17_12855 [Actinobacteria bacterium]|nr:MAG: hypothetical protein E6G17_12855 [Actinomycetota bacterium]
MDRAGHGSRGAAARQGPRPPPGGRSDPPGPDHDAGVEPREPRTVGRRGRPGDRRRARAGGARAAGRHRGHGAGDEEGRRDRRRGR